MSDAPPLPSSPPAPPEPEPEPTPDKERKYVKFKYWDKALAVFFREMGLVQTMRGFENDMLVFNHEWEEQRVPMAMANFVRNIVAMDPSGKNESEDDEARQREIEERKLEYVKLDYGRKPQSVTSVNKSISQFLARKRARNDASNRSEFLYTLDEIRSSLSSSQPALNSADIVSCARTDMKPIDREKQMKYDIAKNEDGPLKRTVKGRDVSVQEGEKDKGKDKDSRVEEPEKKGSSSRGPNDISTAERHPGLDERLVNIEKHLAVRYVPSPPRLLLDRLKFLEDHITKLEKEYPPWAALHFNQPNRGWPPPPRSTPIIVPPQMRSPTTTAPTRDAGPVPTPLPTANTGEGGGPKMRHSSSSLHRAVLERLEVHQALNDLAGPSDTT
ncbi:hypothetical protein AMATHDRAFT_71956 [Amanita thiersii Skay4041]|uniref:Uncharacterized protein n=1 Tax=Amanita thiersii Skay4041 TaxID=703135 RepID=A0A2A9N6D5_9AGAR|nr:hypothetical protein AMATHDRAFT_71956 [Amanita thiersii Skay4041]